MHSLHAPDLLEKNFIFRIHRAALWILGEYCTTSDDIQSIMTLIRQSLGDVSHIAATFETSDFGKLTAIPARGTFYESPSITDWVTDSGNKISKWHG